MSLEQSFRLHYGEGKGKQFERDFRLYKLGYLHALHEVDTMINSGNLTYDSIAKKLLEIDL